MKTPQELQTAINTLETDLESIDWDNGSYGETGEMIGKLDALKWVLGLEEDSWLDALARGEHQYADEDEEDEDDRSWDIRPIY
jgi:hypothetical protein